MCYCFRVTILRARIRIHAGPAASLCGPDSSMHYSPESRLTIKIRLILESNIHGLSKKYPIIRKQNIEHRYNEPSTNWIYSTLHRYIQCVYNTCRKLEKDKILACYINEFVITRVRYSGFWLHICMADISPSCYK